MKLQGFVKQCVKSTVKEELIFKQTLRETRPTRLGETFVELIGNFPWMPTPPVGDLKFEPHIELAITSFQNAGIQQLCGQPYGFTLENRYTWHISDGAFKIAAVRVNQVVEFLRRQGNTEAMWKAVQRHRDVHVEQEHKVRAYLTKVAKTHPNGCVRRFDLRMFQSSTTSAQEEFYSLHNLRNKYLQVAKQVFGRAIAGVVSKIDRDDPSIYQVHVLMVFDGPSETELVSIQEDMADGWRRLTENQGYLLDCDAVDDFQYRGTGSISRGHASVASQLDKAATFLADTDGVVQVGYEGAPSGLVIGE